MPSGIVRNNGVKKRGFGPHTIFEINHGAIFNMFNEGYNNVQVAEQMGVTKQAAGHWHQHWRAAKDFMDDPPAIKAMKKQVEITVRRQSANDIIETHSQKMSLAKQVSNIDMLREKGLTIIEAAMERVLDLVAKEKSIKSLASLIASVAPYSLTRKNADLEKELSIGDRRMAFVQNVMNVYNNNIKLPEHETDEDDQLDGYTEEPSAGTSGL